MSTERTAHKWLAIPEQDLPTELAKALTPGPSKHYCLSSVRGVHWVYICDKCGREYDGQELDKQGIYAKCWNIFPGIKPDCPVPDPIKIGCWNTAKYWQGKCDRDKWYAMMEELYYTIPEDICRCPWEWVIFDAQPKHYLIAAAMAVERKEDG